MSGMRVFKPAAVVFACALLAGVAASAQMQLPLHPAPPGTVIQKAVAYLAGDGMHSRYQIIASRTPLGRPVQYHWHLSVYAQNGDQDFRLAYESPSATDRYELVPKLEPGHGTTMFFPQESVSIVGSAQLMGEARDQTLVLVHEAAADCGESTLSILAAGDGVVSVPVQVENLCSLSATIQHHTIVLSGPYYNSTAPAYKPTKNHATASLRYVDGRWMEHPQYFKLRYPKQPPAAVSPLVSPSPMFTPIFKAIISTPAPTGAPAPPRV